MFNAIPAIRSANAVPPIPDDPSVIFGANLLAWYDAAVGVTHAGSPDRVTAWADQSGGGRNATAATGPRYLAADGDGTPSIRWDPADPSYQMNIGGPALPVGPATTLYALCKSDNTADAKALLWADTGFLSGMFNHASTGGLRRPAVYYNATSKTTAVGSYTAWDVYRLGGRNSPQGRAIAMNDEADTESLALDWPAGDTWTSIGRTVADQGPKGFVKQIIVVNQYIRNTDPRHQQMLDYFAYRYPTLVVY